MKSTVSASMSFEQAVGGECLQPWIRMVPHRLAGWGRCRFRAEVAVNRRGQRRGWGIRIEKSWGMRTRASLHRPWFAVGGLVFAEAPSPTNIRAHFR